MAPPKALLQLGTNYVDASAAAVVLLHRPALCCCCTCRQLPVSCATPARQPGYARCTELAPDCVEATEPQVSVVSMVPDRTMLKQMHLMSRLQCHGWWHVAPFIHAVHAICMTTPTVRMSNQAEGLHTYGEHVQGEACQCALQGGIIHFTLKPTWVSTKVTVAANLSGALPAVQRTRSHL